MVGFQSAETCIEKREKRLESLPGSRLRLGDGSVSHFGGSFLVFGRRQVRPPLPTKPGYTCNGHCDGHMMVIALSKVVI